jgi:hypothetical protein
MLWKLTFWIIEPLLILTDSRLLNLILGIALFTRLRYIGHGHENKVAKFYIRMNFELIEIRYDARR